LSGKEATLTTFILKITTLDLEEDLDQNGNTRHQTRVSPLLCEIMTMLIPENRPTHPGEFVREDILVELNLTQGELAEKLGVSRRSINQLVNEKRGVTADMALRLGKFTNTSPQMWLNLQTAVDLWHETDNQ
jgi:addiction module HigA family antidote